MTAFGYENARTSDFQTELNGGLSYLSKVLFKKANEVVWSRLCALSAARPTVLQH